LNRQNNLLKIKAFLMRFKKFGMPKNKEKWNEDPILGITHKG
jgi:hypothetical protein